MKIKFINIIFFIIILLLFNNLLYASVFSYNPLPYSGWHVQTLPVSSGQNITDLTFIDTLIGYAITNNYLYYDSTFILKTTNGGDNWYVLYCKTWYECGFNRIIFVNENTGFAAGIRFLKTTNGGANWFNINIPYNAFIKDMNVLNEDTIWYVNPDNNLGGVYRTINGGINWYRIYSSTTDNPDKIIMLDRFTGFIANNSLSPIMRKTTNGGFNWFPVLNEGFSDIYFADNLTGWKCFIDEKDSIKKTTNCGLTWFKQTLPQLTGQFSASRVCKFSKFSKDTIWAVGGWINSSGIIYRTTNGGNNWSFQIPDTSFGIHQFNHLTFINSRVGWAYSMFPIGVHTVTGGDTIFYFGIRNLSSIIPKSFTLYQNYPNPFNPVTKIKFSLPSPRWTSGQAPSEGGVYNVRLVVYDVLGREVATLIPPLGGGQEGLKSGTYEADWDASNYPSGVYFYKLITDSYSETKKMVLMK